MNRVTVETAGPIMEDLCRVEISDDFDNDTFHLDNSEVEDARQGGMDGLLALVAENSGRAYDILLAAIQNDSPVQVDGQDVAPEALEAALKNANAPKA